jgi:transcriptional regulator with XRE-family HTH domain
MTFAEMIAVNREKLGLSKKEFAEKCDLPVELISYIEDPEQNEERLIDKCAAALDMEIEVFKGEKEPEPTFEEKIDAAIKVARFPKIRSFLLNPDQCLQPEHALALFAEERVSLAERNLILHLSTNALYKFCETNSSHFKFDDYLFKMHNQLFTRLEQVVTKLTIPDEEKQDRLATARNNVFACDTMENIAIRVVEPFADELENRLEKGEALFFEDLDLPLRWDCDEELMKIRILNEDSSVKREIKLLTVKEREKAEKKQ